MGILPACSVAMRDASLSVATTSCPASARQLPETSPTYPHPITANFTRDFPLRWSYILTILAKICTNSFSPNMSTGGKRMPPLLRRAHGILAGFKQSPHPSGFLERKISDDERVDPGTEITAHRIVRRNNQRLAKKVERCIHQHGRGSELAESIEQPPKRGVRRTLNHMQTHAASRKEKSVQQAGGFRLGKTQRGHEMRGRCAIEKFRGPLGRHGNRERPERFAMLHILVQIFFDVGRPRRSQQAAISQRARPEFGGTLKPSYDFSGDKQLDRFLQDLFLAHVKPVAGLAIVQDLLDFLAGVSRPKGQLRCRSLPRFPLHVMSHEPCGAQSGAFISRGGLNENIMEARIFFHVRHHYGIQKQSPCEAQRFRARLFSVSLGNFRRNFGASLLNARGKLLANCLWNRWTG